MENRRILVDTSIIIDYFRKKVKSKSLLVYLLSSKYNLTISAITVFELFNGATTEQKKRELEKICSYFEIIPFSKVEAKTASLIYNQLYRQNKLIEIRDILIAGTALAHNLPLATFNQKHFERVKDLELLDFPNF